MRGGRGPIRRSNKNFPLLALTLSVPLLALLGFLGYRFFDRSRPDLPRPVSQRARAKIAPGSRNAARRTKKIVLIVDDVGYDDKYLSALTSLNVKLNFAVIPGTPNARRSAEMLGRRGFEVLCHLPMEPLGHPDVSAGAGAILTSMTSAEVRSTTRQHIRSIPYARGVNNHMGSRATTDRRVMGAVMDVLEQEGAYFVDSMTTPDSLGVEVARGRGVRVVSRNVFLDHDVAEAAVRKQLSSLVAIAEQKGIAVGIAHLHPATVSVLQQEVPRLEARGFRFVSAAEAVN